MKKIVSLLMSVFLLFSLCACNNKTAENPEDYVKLSENQLYFYSSDKDFDLFLNDFYTKHSRSSLDTAINAMELGKAQSCWKDWESMSLLWFDSTAKNFRSDSFALIRQWLYSIPVDDYGYVWTSSDTEKTNQNPKNTFGMGWPFPNYGGNRVYDWEFNTNEDQEGWEVISDGIITAPWSAKDKDGNVRYYFVSDADGKFLCKINNASYITYYITDANLPTARNPFLEFDLRWTLGGTNNNIDDIYVSFKTDDGTETTVKVSELTAQSRDISNLYVNHVYMPMYLNENWGMNNDKIVTDISITVKAKASKTFSGDFGLNFVRGNYDSRQIDNLFDYVSTLKQYYEFVGDVNVLKDNIANYRKALLFLIYNLGGESGLVDLSKFVGHNGGVISDGVKNTIGSSYWDVLSLSPKSLYAQVLYYQTLENSLFLENVLKNLNISEKWPTIKLFNEREVAFSLTTDRIAELMQAVKSKVQASVDKNAKTGYYDTEKGRFIEGFNMHGDVVDYGSTVFNNMVVAANMATIEQAKNVCAWINGDRIIEGDNARGYKGDMEDPDNAGIYDYIFAPRVTTLKNYEQYTSGHSSEAGYLYGESCQDGGAILFTSYYDMMARFITNGAEDTFRRLSAIKDWYLEIYNYNVKEMYDTPSEFYRNYYDNLGISLQGNDIAGSLGLDSEFLENAIVYAIVPFAFFGLEGTSDGCLSITPSLPSGLKFWRMENLMFHNIRYDIQIGKNYVLIESVRGNTLNQTIKLNFAFNGKEPKVYIDGVRVDSSYYVFENNTVYIETDFSAKKVEVK